MGARDCPDAPRLLFPLEGLWPALRFSPRAGAFEGFWPLLLRLVVALGRGRSISRACALPPERNLQVSQPLGGGRSISASACALPPERLRLVVALGLGRSISRA